MSSFLRGWLLGVAVLFITAARLPAAPAPVKGSAPGDLTRYLADDTDVLAILDVRLLLKFPALVALAKHRAVVDALHTADGPANVLGKCGIDVLRDVDRFVWAAGKSCYPAGVAATQSGGVLLLQGRFASLRQQMAKLARTRGSKWQEETAGKATVYRRDPSDYLVVLDDSTVLLTSNRKQALDRATQTILDRRARWSHPAMARFVKGLRADRPFQMLALESAVVNSHQAETVKGGKKELQVRHQTLGENHIRMLSIRVEGSKELQTTAELTCTSAEHANQLHANIQAVRTLMVQGLMQEQGKKLQPVISLVEGARATREGMSCIIESKASPEAVRQAFEALFALAQLGK